MIASPKLVVHRWVVCLLDGSAALALEETSGDEAVRRVAQSFQVLLWLCDADLIGRLVQGGVIANSASTLATLIRDPHWPRASAEREIVPVLDDLLADLTRALDPRTWASRRVVAAIQGATLPEWSMSHALTAESSRDDSVRMTIALMRLCKLGLLVDAHHAEHGKWPTTCADLGARIDAQDAVCPIDGYEFQLGVRSTEVEIALRTPGGAPHRHLSSSIRWTR